MKPSLEPVKKYFLSLQDQISIILTEFDPAIILSEDKWSTHDRGGGKTRAFSGDKIFEKAGVNFSHVFGMELPPSAIVNKTELKGTSFQVVGLSIIIHPCNPFIPTCHANLRFFIAESKQNPTYWWFGGGFDLTPYYAFEEDCIHWHQVAKKACDPFGLDVYPRFKKWADDYFYLPHRQEARGVGGIFFDDLNQWDFETSFLFVKSIGEHFKQAYFPIVKKRKDLPFGQRERQFQCFRRGRYVEFNLLYDRGTLFGLQSGGRIESILISLPPMVSWRYNWYPEKGTPERELYDKFLPPQDWANRG
jgi:coproporphyrinogen III oxidase